MITRLTTVPWQPGLYQARVVGRTLVPWVMYTTSMGRVEMLDWDSVFNFTVLEECHKVITMKQFMEEQADQI